MAGLIQTSPIGVNLGEVRRRIERASLQSGRSPNAATLIAVSKTHPASSVQEAIEAGQLAFGENRVQEARQKFDGLREAHPGLKLHMIGPLQTNKVRDAVALFDAIHSIDRPKLAQAVADEMARQSRKIACFVEVNIGREPQKAGIAPADLDSFLVNCKERYGLPIAGLMCIPPMNQDPAPHFRALAALGRKCGVSCLSMGMSGDFEAGIATGATHVRVGSLIFGARS